MPDQKRLTPEMLVPRMGEYLVQKGLITAEDLQRRWIISRRRPSGEIPSFSGRP
jgi:hypothetical protein